MTEEEIAELVAENQRLRAGATGEPVVVVEQPSAAVIAAEADATVAVIEAQTEAQVTVMEAAATIDAARDERLAESESGEHADDDAGAVVPRSDHWFFKPFGGKR